MEELVKTFQELTNVPVNQDILEETARRVCIGIFILR